MADADQAVARVQERTGTVAVGPVPFGDTGRGVLAADPQGAIFGLWEGSIFADWRSAPGDAPAWVELRTRDALAAALFYGEVLGWANEQPGCCAVSYEQDRVVLRQGGHVVARLTGGPVVEASVEPVRRPRWHVHFAVPSLDAAVATAMEWGGSTPARSLVSGHGACRATTLCDPDGALFTVWESAWTR